MSRVKVIKETKQSRGDTQTVQLARSHVKKATSSLSRSDSTAFTIQQTVTSTDVHRSSGRLFEMYINLLSDE